MNSFFILSTLTIALHGSSPDATSHAHFAHVLVPRNHRALVVLPEINGDIKKLMALLYQARLSVGNYRGTMGSHSEELRSKSVPVSELVAGQPRTDSDVELITLGNVGNAKSKDSSECYSLLFAVEKVLGWNIRPLYGSYELELIRPSPSEKSHLVNFIMNRFAMIVHVVGSDIPPTGFRGSNTPNLVVMSGDVHKFPLDILTARLGSRPDLFRIAQDLQSPRDAHVCQNVVRSITQFLRVGRIITTNDANKDWSSRCGSRLVSLSPRSESILFHKFRPVILTRVAKTESSLIWPPPPMIPPMKTANIDLNRFDYLVVIPDIHGDLQSFAKTLWLAYKRVTKTSMSMDKFTHLILSDKPAIASRSLRVYTSRVLSVFLGDYVDKGPHSRECLELLLNIERLLGWSVVALYGNHEYMNLHRTADAYIHPNDKLQGISRDRAFSIDGMLWKRLSAKLVLAARATGPGGRYLFVHGSMDPSWFANNKELLAMLNGSPSSIDDINRVNKFWSEQSPDLTHILREADSPVWSRSIETMTDDELCTNHLPKLLDMWRVDKIFIGHNPQTLRRVRVRCNGKAFLTDVGISRWMFDDNGNPMAIVEDLRSRAAKGTMESIYLDRVETIA